MTLSDAAASDKFPALDWGNAALLLQSRGQVAFELKQLTTAYALFAAASALVAMHLSDTRSDEQVDVICGQGSSTTEAAALSLWGQQAIRSRAPTNIDSSTNSTADAACHACLTANYHRLRTLLALTAECGIGTAKRAQCELKATSLLEALLADGAAAAVPTVTFPPCQQCKSTRGSTESNTSAGALTEIGDARGDMNTGETATSVAASKMADGDGGASAATDNNSFCSHNRLLTLADTSVANPGDEATMAMSSASIAEPASTATFNASHQATVPQYVADAISRRGNAGDVVPATSQDILESSDTARGEKTALGSHAAPMSADMLCLLADDAHASGVAPVLSAALRALVGLFDRDDCGGGVPNKETLELKRKSIAESEAKEDTWMKRVQILLAESQSLDTHTNAIDCAHGNEGEEERTEGNRQHTDLKAPHEQHRLEVKRGVVFKALIKTDAATLLYDKPITSQSLDEDGTAHGPETARSHTKSKTNRRGKGDGQGVSADDGKHDGDHNDIDTDTHPTDGDDEALAKHFASAATVLSQDALLFLQFMQLPSTPAGYNASTRALLKRERDWDNKQRVRMRDNTSSGNVSAAETTVLMPMPMISDRITRFRHATNSNNMTAHANINARAKLAARGKIGGLTFRGLEDITQSLWLSALHANAVVPQHAAYLLYSGGLLLEALARACAREAVRLRVVAASLPVHSHSHEQSQSVTDKRKPGVETVDMTDDRGLTEAVCNASVAAKANSDSNADSSVAAMTDTHDSSANNADQTGSATDSASFGARASSNENESTNATTNDEQITSDCEQCAHDSIATRELLSLSLRIARTGAMMAMAAVQVSVQWCGHSLNSITGRSLGSQPLGSGSRSASIVTGDSRLRALRTQSLLDRVIQPYLDAFHSDTTLLTPVQHAMPDSSSSSSSSSSSTSASAHSNVSGSSTDTAAAELEEAVEQAERVGVDEAKVRENRRLLSVFIMRNTLEEGGKNKKSAEMYTYIKVRSPYLITGQHMLFKC